MLQNVAEPPIRQSDLVIFVPMDEEYLSLSDVFPATEGFMFKGFAHHWLPKLGFLNNVILFCPNCQGPNDALSAAHHILTHFSISAFCVTGIAGGIHPDVHLGHVVLADAIADYSYRGKLVDNADSGYRLAHGGREWPLAEPLCTVLKQIRIGAGDLYKEWCDRAAAEAAAWPGLEDGAAPQLHFGKILSGPSVVASKEFSEQLREISRLYLACEMESAGVALAVRECQPPVPVIVVRGVSDLASPTKSSLDALGGGAWRRQSMRNAALLLRQLSNWPAFTEAVAGADDWQRVVIEVEFPANISQKDFSSRIAALRKSFGGRIFILKIRFASYHLEFLARSSDARRLTFEGARRELEAQIGAKLLSWSITPGQAPAEKEEVDFVFDIRTVPDFFVPLLEKTMVCRKEWINGFEYYYHEARRYVSENKFYEPALAAIYVNRVRGFLYAHSNYADPPNLATIKIATQETLDLSAIAFGIFRQRFSRLVHESQVKYFVNRTLAAEPQFSLGGARNVQWYTDESSK